MSYITDDPLSKEEARILRKQERYHNYQEKELSPSILHSLKVPYTSNQFVNTISELPARQLIVDYFKIDIRSQPDAYLLNTFCYHKLMQLVKSRYGSYPEFNSLICDSITIMPKPFGRCSLYYQSGKNKTNDNECNYELVGSFVNDGYSRKYEIGSPYVDSIYGNKNVRFNWLGNDKSTGKIIPKVYGTDFFLMDVNGCMPWVSNDMMGSYYIDGICDAIGFKVSFMANDKMMLRKRWTPSHRRGFNVKQKKKYLVGPPGDVQYEVEEGSDFQGEGDPLLEAFQQ